MLLYANVQVLSNRDSFNSYTMLECKVMKMVGDAGYYSLENWSTVSLSRNSGVESTIQKQNYY